MTSAVYRSGATFGEARSVVVPFAGRGAAPAGFRADGDVVPSDAVIKPIGAGGYPAALVGMFAFAAYLAATMLGLHSPSEQRNPIRVVLCLLWLSVLASYVLMDRSVLTVPELAAADRQLMQLAVITGVALVAAEWLDSLSDIRRVLRALCWGGAFCRCGGALQFWLSLDLAVYLRDLPGFSLNLRQRRDPGPRRDSTGSAGRPSTRSNSEWWPGCCCHSPSTWRSTTRSAASLAPVGAGGPDRARDPCVGIPLGDHLGRLALAVLVVLMPVRAAAGRALRRAVRLGGGLHVGPRPDRHPDLLLRRQAPAIRRWPTRVTDYPLVERFSGAGPVVRPGRRDVLRGQRI